MAGAGPAATGASAQNGLSQNGYGLSCEENVTYHTCVFFNTVITGQCHNRHLCFSCAEKGHYQYQ